MRNILSEIARIIKWQTGRTAMTLESELRSLRKQVADLQVVAAQNARSPSDAEFQVYSQWGEDGIIQYLIGRVPIAEPVFVEFGVESYTEANTRFLLEHDNWRGLIMDASGDHARFLDTSGLRWRYHIDHVTAFITADNVNDLIAGAGIEGDIGLLSIDVDGMDYWLLEAIEVVSPRILIVEYNSIFGPNHVVTVPYAASFHRTSAHSSNLYWGASLPALTRLARRKGYALVASNTAGNNAFFVRRDVLSDIAELTAAEAWVESRFRESRDTHGHLSHVSSHEDRLALIQDECVVDLRTGVTERIRDVYQLDITSLDDRGQALHTS